MAFVGGQQAKLSELETRLAALETAATEAKATYVVTGVPNNALGKNGDVALDVGDPLTSTGLIYHKVAGAWVSTTFQAFTA